MKIFYLKLFKINFLLQFLFKYDKFFIMEYLIIIIQRFLIFNVNYIYLYL